MISRFLPFLPLLAVVGKDVYYQWDLDSILSNDLSPDCMNVKDARRYSFLANGRLPGPVVEANEGDTIHVVVTNHHPTEEVSIHWHGIHQRGTPYMDGPSYLTQCPLGTKSTQEYVFEAYPPGTHYWHAHGSLHIADGLTGPLIVRPAAEPFLYDAEAIFFLQDRYIQSSTEQLIGLLNWPFTWIGNPNSLLINGKGIAPQCQVGGLNFNDTLVCLETCQDDKTTLLNVTEVEEGKTYRFRIINAGQLVMANFAIAQHNLTVVQVEGTNVNSFTVDSIDIAPGQRYDVLVVMDQPAGSYLIETTVRARLLPPELKGQAILQYVDATNLTFPQESPAHPAWNETSYGVNFEKNLTTLDVTEHSESTALTADESKIKRFIVVGTQNEYWVDGEPQLLVWSVNNISDIKSDEPLIGQAYREAQESGWPTDLQGTRALPSEPPFVWDYTQNVTSPEGPGAPVGSREQVVIALEEGDIVEIVLQNARALNGVAEFHPWHAHGHSFWVVGSGEGSFDPATHPATYNLVNPVLRDTLNVWPLQWTAIRLVANNPGVWFFHCHIVSHQLMGMGFVLVTQPDVLEGPPESVLYCGSDNLSGTEGNSTGKTDSASSTLVFHPTLLMILLGSLFLST